MKNPKLLTVILLFFFIRTINLTRLPIFNDEAIYLDWGWRMTHVPGYLYYSLYDAKQPLVMWLFGIAATLFSDPLFAGRLVSVVFGFISLLGIYKVSRLFLSQNFALLTCIFYIFIPLFSFFDRQVLIESAMTTINIWSCYLLLRSLPSDKVTYPLSLGLLLGIGYWMKTTAALFLFSFLFLSLISFIKTREKKLLKKSLIVLSVFLSSIFLLLLNPLFWETLPTNERYVLTVPEIFRFPIRKWFENVISNTELSMIFLTPSIYIAAIIGTILFIKEKKGAQLLLWIFVTIFLQTLFVRNISTRYLVSFLPLLPIPAVFGVQKLFARRKATGYVSMILLLIPAVFLTIIQIFSPHNYFTVLSKFTRFSDESSYVSSALSGYGIPEVVANIKEDAKGEKTFIGLALNTGNPESAIITYFRKSPTVTTGYFDAQLLGAVPQGTRCLKIKDTPKFYFVSREDQQGELNAYLQKWKTIKNPYGYNTIGIYVLKTDCQTPPLELDRETN